MNHQKLILKDTTYQDRLVKLCVDLHKTTDEVDAFMKALRKEQENEDKELLALYIIVKITREAKQMDWDTIMSIKDPHEALVHIVAKIDKENLSIDEMMDKTDEYAEKHGIPDWEMFYFKNGNQVVQPYYNWIFS